jgi:hypothetical protein
MNFKEVQAWNTKRGYSRAGQRIAAGIDENHFVTFADIDRMIYGRITERFNDESTELRRFVMWHYDRCNYDDCATPVNLIFLANKI